MLIETSMPPVFNIWKCATRADLFRAVREAMESHGNDCDLNHLDVSVITNFRSIFQHSPFCGNISRWHVSNAINMERMFEGSAFNGDLSQWSVSNAINMERMFEGSAFNGDISQWNVSNAISMERMFESSAFNGDLSKWSVKKVKGFARIFHNSDFAGDLSAWQVQKDAIIFEPLNAKKMAVMATTVFHWYMADSSPDSLSPIQRRHLNTLAPIAQGIGLTKKDTAFWLQEQWLEKSAPALSYTLPEMVLE